MKRLLGLLVVPVIAAIATLNVSRAAPLTYGTLDNFDVINDTGQETHGFEIEMDGIRDTDVVYTFAAPYIRYDPPSIVPTPTGVIVRYAAAYSASTGWSATTPIAVAPYLPTQGHSCWTGGVVDPLEYYSSGCDHFGVSLNATPTNTAYRWLVASPSAPGVLTPFGTDVKLPAPTWNVAPPVTPGAQPVVVAVIAPPAPNGYEFGDALWAKVFVTELPDALQPADLEHMVIDDPVVDIMPEPAEVEFEWKLLQDSTGGGGEQEFGGAAEIGAGSEAVSRRFEFYAYTGYYDPETHEARCDDPLDPAQQGAEQCGEPDADGVAGVGALIGTQNVAVNVAGVFAANDPPVAGCTSPSVVAAADVCSAPASVNAGSSDPNGDSISLSQSPAGPYVLGATSVTLTVTDNRGLSDSCQAVVTVVDATPPSITTVAATPSLITTANGKMIPVSVAVTRTDACDAAPICKVVTVASSESDPGIKGDKSPDWQITGDLTVSLRAQRDKKGPGRTYTIGVTCSDAAGNASSGTTTVVVNK